MCPQTESHHITEDPVSEHNQHMDTNRITPHHRRSCLRTQLLCAHKQNHTTSQKILSHNTITMCPQTESHHITEEHVSEHNQHMDTNRITPHHRRSCLITQLPCAHKQNHTTSQKILSQNTISTWTQTESHHITEDPVSEHNYYVPTNRITPHHRRSCLITQLHVPTNRITSHHRRTCFQNTINKCSQTESHHITEDPVSEHNYYVPTNRITPHHRRSCCRAQSACVHKPNNTTS